MRIRLSVWALAFAGMAGGLQAQSAATKDILAAIMLPRAAADVRREGVPAKDVSGVLDILRKKNVRPAEARNVLLTERDVARNQGPADNFGAFVQSKLDQGLRGQELAAAIRAEHGLAPRPVDKKVEKAKGTEKKAVNKAKPKPKPKAKPAQKAKPTTDDTRDPMGH